MSERLVNVDRETPLLLPVDLRDWVPGDDLVHFVINAVETMKLSALSVNRRGTGDEQYPPRMMLALLIYSYAVGVFGSRRIERATYRDLAVRYLTGDTHPDHATICAFRRENGPTIQEAFLEVLKLAREMKLLKVGTISVDGTHIKANASKHKSVRYDRAGELEQLLRKDIAELMQRAERSDNEPAADEQKLPKEIARRERLLAKMQEARRHLEERARGKDSGPEGPAGTGSGKGNEVGGSGSSSAPTPKDSQQINLTDPDSSLMRKSHYDSYVQAYNAQAVVDADGSQLIVATDVLQTPADSNQLEAAVHNVSPDVGEVKRALADGGYVNVESFDRLEKERVELYVAVTGEDRQRRYDYRPPSGRPHKKVIDPRLVEMQAKVLSEQGKPIYARRAATVEPVFGIIKGAMGFRQFLLRGIEKVKVEWNLVCLAYDVKRLWSLAGG
jgi:transposase